MIEFKISANKNYMKLSYGLSFFFFFRKWFKLNIRYNQKRVKKLYIKKKKKHNLKILKYYS